MADNENKLSLDASQYLNEMRQLNRITELGSVALKNFIDVTTKYNTAGIAQERQIRGVTEEGKKFVATFKEAGKLKSVKVFDDKNVENFDKQVKLFGLLMRKLEADEKKHQTTLQKISKEIAKGFKEEEQEIQKSVKSFGKIVREREREYKSQQRVLRQISKEIAQGFKEEEREIQQAVKSFGKIVREREREYKSQQRVLRQISKEIAQGFKEEEREIQKSLKSFGKIVRERERDYKNQQKILKQISKEIAQGFKEEEREIQRAVKSFGKIVREREREYRNQQKVLNQIAKEIAQGFKEEEREIRESVKSFGKIMREREREYKNQQRVLRQISKEIAQGFKEEEKEIREAVKSFGKIMRERERERKRLAKEAVQVEVDAIKAIMSEARNAYTERKRLDKESTDAAIAEIKREMNAARNAQVERKRLEKQTNAEEANLLTSKLQRKFGGRSLNFDTISVTSLNKINAALGAIEKTVTQGKASAQDYSDIISRMGTNSLGNLTTGQQRILAQVLRLKEAYASAESPINKFGKSIRDAGKNGSDAGQSVLLTWRGVVRLFIVQTLHQSLNALLNLFKANADEAARFSVGIGEILTISQQTAVSYNDLSASIQSVSDRFGVAPLDAVAASYEAISNQVVDATRQHNFLTESFKFAAVTQTNAKTATNLLSSAINSYKLNASDAEKISAVFFEVINLGRVRAEEMGDTFGRVGSLAAQMGITLEEVGASITVLTRQGIRYSEAYTLINNIVLKLLKPTGEFKDLLKQYGFASGEAAVKTLGFGNVLKILDTEAQKGNQRLGELLDEMRAIRGAVGLTGEGLQEFNKDLQKIQGAEAIDRYRKALDIVNNTSGKQFLVNTEQIKNYFTRVYGTAFIDIFNNVIKQFGGATASANLFAKALFALATQTAAYLTLSKLATISAASQTLKYLLMAAQISDVTFKTQALGLAFKSLATSNVFIFAISTALTAIVTSVASAATRLEDLKNNAKRIYDDLAEAREEYMKRIRDSLNAESREYNNTLNAIISTVGQFNANILAGLNARGKELEETYKNVAKNVKSSFEAITDILKDRLKSIETDIDNFIKKSDDAFDKAKEIEKNIPQTRFEQELNAAPTDENKAVLLQTKFDELRAQADAFLSKGKFQEAFQLLEEAKKIGDQLGQTLTTIYRNSSKEAEKAFKDAGKAARDAAKAEEREQLKIATEIEQRLNRRGNTLTAADRDRLRRERENALANAQRAREAQARGANALENVTSAEQARATINNQVLDVMNQQLVALTGIAEKNDEAAASTAKRLEAEKEAQANLEKALTNVLDIKVDTVDPKALTEQFNAAREELRKNTQLSGKEKIDITLKLAELEKNALEQIENAKSVKSGEARQKELTDIKEQYDKEQKLLEDKISKEQELLNESAGKAKEELFKVQELLKEALQANIEALKVPDPSGNLDPKVFLENINKIKDALANINSIQIGDTLDETAINKIKELLSLTFKLRPDSKTFIGLDKESIKVLTDARVKLDEITTKGNQLESLRAQFNALNASLQATKEKFSDIPGVAEVFSTSVKSAAERAANEIQALNDRVDALNRSLRESARIPRVLEGSGLDSGFFNNFGGRMSYYANGGRGMDRIPAMLRNDEFVMSAGATRRNFSQLVALNAGHTPKHFNNGGNVTNIGDVNVTLVSNGSNEADARSIAQSIRREMRLRRI